MVRHTSLWLVLMVCCLGIASQTAISLYNHLAIIRNDWYVGFFVIVFAYADILAIVTHAFNPNRRLLQGFFFIFGALMCVVGCTMLITAANQQSAGLVTAKLLLSVATYIYSHKVGKNAGWTWRHLLPPTHINEERLRRRCDPPRRNLPL